MGKKIKNKDIANRLGVSGTLVSLVLNNKADLHGIRKDTQERVLTLARQMGYFESSEEKSELSPIEEKPGVIGMIVPEMNDPFIYSITPFLQKAFASIGVGFSIISKDPDDLRFNRLVNAFRKFYSGLIIVGNSADDYTLRLLKSNDYPFVLLEKTTKKLRLNTVATDMTSGTQLMADHIGKLGYKNLLIATSKGGVRNDSDIVDLFKEALKSNPEINKPMLLEIGNTFSGSDPDFPELEKYLRPPYRTDVLVVAQSENVYPIMTWLQKHNVRIPQDVALVSLEEGPGFDLIHSPVTALRRPLAAIAIKVANIIWSEVKNGGKGKYRRQVNIAPELVIRKSCGANR